MEYLFSINDDERKQALEKMKTPELQFFCDLLLNVYYKKLPISDEAKSQLKSRQELIESLLIPKKSLKNRKKDLLDGDNFNFIFGLLLPEVRKIILD